MQIYRAVTAGHQHTRTVGVPRAWPNGGQLHCVTVTNLLSSWHQCPPPEVWQVTRAPPNEHQLKVQQSEALMQAAAYSQPHWPTGIRRPYQCCISQRLIDPHPPGGVATMLLLKGLVKRSPVLSSAERTPFRLVLVEWDRAVTAEPVTVAPVPPPAAALLAEPEAITRVCLRSTTWLRNSRKHAPTTP